MEKQPQAWTIQGPSQKKKRPGAQAELLSGLKLQGRGRDLHPTKATEELAKSFLSGMGKRGDGEGSSWPPLPWVSEADILSCSGFKAVGDS